MPANIRYTIQNSNRVRVSGDIGLQSVLSAILTVSDLSFETTKKVRTTYSGNVETIVLNELDMESLSISYMEDDGIADGSVAHVREWYKSVSDGTSFEIDLTGTGTYLPCILVAEKYSENRIGTTMTYSVPFRIRWL